MTTEIKTYKSASKGEIAITAMNTVHLQNAVAKVRVQGTDAALLEALETELNKRPLDERTDLAQTA